MGLLLGDTSEEEPIILTDILGLEDAFGTMDFKVAGDEVGITSFQLDIKCEGLTMSILKRALAQAKDARLHVLSIMKKACPSPRETTHKNVPKVLPLKVNPNSLGKIIGPSGKQIRSLIEEFNLNDISVEDDGSVQVSSFDMENNRKAAK